MAFKKVKTNVKVIEEEWRSQVLAFSLGRNPVDYSEMAKYSTSLCRWQSKGIARVKTSSRYAVHSELYNLGRLNPRSKNRKSEVTTTHAP